MNNKFIDFSNSQFVGQDYYDEVSPEDPYPFHTLQRIEKGRRIGSFYMLKYAGIDKQGRWVVYDKDNNIGAGRQCHRRRPPICWQWSAPLHRFYDTHLSLSPIRRLCILPNSVGIPIFQHFTTFIIPPRIFKAM